MYANIFSFGERILIDFDTRDVVLFNSMARPMKLRCRVFHWCYVLNCSHKWLCFSNFCFALIKFAVFVFRLHCYFIWQIVYVRHYLVK